MSEDYSESELLYSQRPEWSDVEPLLQNDGPLPLAVIRYPTGFEEVHDYFRAIRKKGELSERALGLTADVIEHNSANYTAWYYRRLCLKAIAANLIEELAFSDKWAKDSPKNYQVWYHRRWLIAEMADQVANGSLSNMDDVTPEELGKRELEYQMEVMTFNDDYKNYNGWSHRLFILQKFGLWDGELEFVEDLLRDDVRNNSAWNHRYTVIRNTCWPFTAEFRQREMDFTFKAIRRCVSNESAWNYVSAFFGEGEGKVAWNSCPEVKQFCEEVLSSSSAAEAGLCRFVHEVLAKIEKASGKFPEALSHYDTLIVIDKIRAKYWEWQKQLITAAQPEE